MGLLPVVTPTEPEENQTEFNLILKDAGPKKINVIKVIRALTNLGLKEAKDMVEGTPKKVLEGVSKDIATHAKALLEAEGAMVEVIGGSLPHANLSKVANHTEFNLILKDAGTKKINVIKVVYALTNLSLKEAKDMVEGTPQKVLEGVSKDIATHAKALLEAEGAMVEVIGGSLSHANLSDEEIYSSYVSIVSSIYDGYDSLISKIRDNQANIEWYKEKKHESDQIAQKLHGYPTSIDIPSVPSKNTVHLEMKRAYEKLLEILEIEQEIGRLQSNRSDSIRKHNEAKRKEGFDSEISSYLSGGFILIVVIINSFFPGALVVGVVIVTIVTVFVAEQIEPVAPSFLLNLFIFIPSLVITAYLFQSMDLGLIVTIVIGIIVNVIIMIADNSGKAYVKLLDTQNATIENVEDRLSEAQNSALLNLSTVNAHCERAIQITIDSPLFLQQLWKQHRDHLTQTLHNLNAPSTGSEVMRMLTRPWKDAFWVMKDPQVSYTPHFQGLAPGVTRIGDIIIDQIGKREVIPAMIPSRALSDNISDHTPGHVAFVTHDQETRKVAINSLQSIAIRTIATFPVKKMRGVFIDPIGMGNNFPLKGFPEFIVGPKIFTRSDEIREQLRSLTTHIEQVIQKYLSSDYKTIESFNEAKSSIKEPYRYLFIADFPSGFDNASLEDLKSLLINGARAGVYIIIHIDKTLRTPSNFDYGIFQSYCTSISSTNEKSIFAFNLPTGRALKTILDPAPTSDQVGRIGEEISQAIKSVKVETVAFVPLQPHQDDLWSFNSAEEIRAPIGISGALDHIEFWMGYNEDGKVASQALLVGKPGAGKSYTLHAIIVNLAMRYSPDELEMYLLDFKEGVEFQIYIDPSRSETDNLYEELDERSALAHAKVISIDSDREFGLSVMERIQHEIIKRGDQYKLAGVQSLKDFREKQPNARMPRVLVVVDEFQYMFLKNDEVTRKLNVLFDDITRRGRAFGIHLVLATQSPNVANMSHSIYSFIDLRMAMQMDKPTAASVLAQGNIDSVDLIEGPGEIIYNARHGTKGYNVFGRVVDMTLEVRKKALLDIHSIALNRRYERREPLVLFNGLQATRLKRNPQLEQLTNMTSWLSLRDLNKQVINDNDWVVDEYPGVAWMGEAMRIGNHTHAIFRRRSRSNMLIVGNSEETVFGILGGVLISLIHCYKPSEAEFQVIDLSQVDQDSPWSSMTLAFRDEFNALFPTNVGKRTSDSDNNVLRYQTILHNVFNEFERRKSLRDQNPDATNSDPSIFFVVAIGGLNRAQSLRPVMGSRNEQASEDGQMLVKLVSQGSEVGIHSILWFDNIKSFTKLTGEDRSWLTHFDLRVGLTMPPDDSRLLLRETDAQELPRLRALFRDEATSVGLEKFKPYAVPTAQEIKDYGVGLKNRLGERT